jgi:hypothetical protein
MKKIILFIAIFICITSPSFFPQIKIEVGGGYLVPLTNGPVFEHTNKGWGISASGIYNVIENLDLTGTVLYQSRVFEPNSFSFIAPDVLGYSIPIVKSGDNLKSIGFTIGGRFSSNNTNYLQTYFSLDFGLMFFQESFYDLQSLAELGIRTITITPQKYSDAKTLFETSAGFGFVFKLSPLLDIILEGRANLIPEGREVYFPIFTKLRFNL